MSHRIRPPGSSDLGECARPARQRLTGYDDGTIMAKVLRRWPLEKEIAREPDGTSARTDRCDGKCGVGERAGVPRFVGLFHPVEEAIFLGERADRDHSSWLRCDRDNVVPACGGCPNHQSHRSLGASGPSGARHQGYGLARDRWPDGRAEVGRAGSSGHPGLSAPSHAVVAAGAAAVRPVTVAVRRARSRWRA